MTTRRFSRLVIGIAALAFVVVLLFSGTIAFSAGKGDRSAPTVPTNLTITAITSTSVSLSWGASSDNSGKLSYRVRINRLNSSYTTLASVEQTQTTYVAKGLFANTGYSFAVYAVDANGNRSADSNLQSTNTLADTTPPKTPVLSANVLGPSQVQLTWTDVTDDVPLNCCNWGFKMNGSTYTGPINWMAAPAGSLSASIRHLPAGSTNTFAITVGDYSGGNVATSNSVSVTTPSSTDTTPPSAPTNLHLVRDDTCGEVWIGWTQATDNADPQRYIEYEIYVNGVLSPLPISGGIDVDFVYANFHGDNIFTVKAVDRSGNSSQASGPLKLFLWPC